MIFAPVIIPTLNRCAHLKRCITSLQANSGAAMTELYISLDYPPENSKYKEGYEKTLELLQSGIQGFKKVHIFIQSHNLGPTGNIKFLQSVAYSKHDRLILSEDDNEFAPAFLEYMNQMLEKFEHDPNAYEVCGHAYPIKWTENGSNIVKCGSLVDGWGIGFWREKEEIIQKRVGAGKFRESAYDIKKVLRLAYQARGEFVDFVSYLYDQCPEMKGTDGDVVAIDTVLGIMNIWYGGYCIMPRKSFVRNWGDDGSGEHTGTQKCWSEQEIDEKPHFFYISSSAIKVMQSDIQKLNCYHKVVLSNYIKSWIKLFAYYIFGRKNSTRLFNMRRGKK